MFLIECIRIARWKSFIVCEAGYLLPIRFLPGRLEKVVFERIAGGPGTG